MNLRETFEHELASLEFNRQVLPRMKTKVKDVCIAVLFEDNHCHVVVPNDVHYRERIKREIQKHFKMREP